MRQELLSLIDQLPESHLAILLDLSNLLQEHPDLAQTVNLEQVLENCLEFQRKFAAQQQEIAQWHATFIRQQEELKRCKLKIEAQQQKLLHLEDTLAAQRREICSTHTETQKLREHVTRNSEELEQLRHRMQVELERLERQCIYIELQRSLLVEDDHYQRNQLN